MRGVLALVSGDRRQSGDGGATEITVREQPSDHVRYVGGILRNWGRNGPPPRLRPALARDGAVPERRATDKQRAYIADLLDRAGLTLPDFYGVDSLEQLTLRDAGYVVEALKSGSILASSSPAGVPVGAVRASTAEDPCAYWRLEMSADEVERIIEADQRAIVDVDNHSRASRASVRGRLVEDVLVVEVRDDGMGGADPATGTALAGLADRIAVVDGRLLLSSPAGGPTLVRMEIPCVQTVPSG